ncbi:hypothetical protein H2203_008119 [Taxawa tesnikishii (nom. ined.)]|nr:hypothetical protein H2203_008119 [Dothideales sp. JES 119]
MSDDEIVAGPPGATSADLRAPDLKPKYKSWRKKYRKMKFKFEDVMKDSNNLYKEEKKLEALSKRLQEQNDQLLDLLLDLNSNLHIPQELRYNLLNPSDDINPASDVVEPLDPATAELEVRNAHQGVASGEYLQTHFLKVKKEYQEKLARQNATKLVDMEARIPHTVFNGREDDIPDHLVDMAEGTQPGFMSAQHEDDYLLRMDAKLGDQYSLAQPRPTSPPNLSTMTPRELEREIELKNPQSVHNWLKKHNPQVVADIDKDSEVGGPTTSATPGGGGGGKGKRGTNLAKKMGDRAVERARGREEGSPGSAATKTEQDLLDEEIGYVDETPASAGKGKRTRDPDESYRPKGDGVGRVRGRGRMGRVGEGEEGEDEYGECG